MPPTQIATPAEDDLASDERWALVTRIVANSHFARAVQLRELLLYLAKQAILSPSEDVSEQEIGCRVLGRRPDYDPQADNIVRVQIRRLRQKIYEYFETDGRQEQIVISIPKGSHVLRFEPRFPAAKEMVAASPGSIDWRWRLAPIVAMVLVAFFLGRASKNKVAAASLPPKPHLAGPLWSRMFVEDKPTSIVIADSSIVIVQNALNKSITLNEYIDRSYRNQIEAAKDAGVRDILRMIAGRQYTSLADATIASELLAMGAKSGARVQVRYSRHINIRDFNTGNHVLVGSRHGVPWSELFEAPLNFQFDRIGPDQRYGFRNKRPISGESAAYMSRAPMNGPQENYATISMVPNLTHSGNVLMLNGITMEATEAAGEFAASPEFSATLTKVFGASSPDKLPNFQVLLKVASMAGAPHKVEVVAWRKLHL